MEPAEINLKWSALQQKIADEFDNEKPDLKVMLFLIGVQELGYGPQTYTKEQKQDLMHIAVCTLLAQSGYYILEGHDDEGWPHFKQLKPLPPFNLFEQENFLKDHALLYFEEFMQ